MIFLRILRHIRSGRIGNWLNSRQSLVRFTRKPRFFSISSRPHNTLHSVHAVISFPPSLRWFSSFHTYTNLVERAPPLLYARRVIFEGKNELRKTQKTRKKEARLQEVNSKIVFKKIQSIFSWSVVVAFALQFTKSLRFYFEWALVNESIFERSIMTSNQNCTKTKWQRRRIRGND